jgi:hypothetical protein
LAEGERSVHMGQEPRIGGVGEARLIGVGWYHEHAYSEVTQYIAEPIPLRDRDGSIDDPARPPTCPGVWVCSTLDAEIRRVSHQDRARCTHGAGIPGGSAAGSNPPACSR